MNIRQEVHRQKLVIYNISELIGVGCLFWTENIMFYMGAGKSPSGKHIFSTMKDENNYRYILISTGVKSFS